jgi:hypothetical protein
MDGDKQNYWQGDHQEVDHADMSDDGSFEPIVWDASEYVHNEKHPLWLVVLTIVTVALAVGFYLLLQSITFTVLIVVMGIAVGIYAVRPPRTIHYELSESGLMIDEKLYHPNDFRAFGVVQEGALNSIVLLPTKRFLPLISIYFPVEHGEKIVDILGGEIPMEPIRLDFVDNLVRKLRF